MRLSELQTGSIDVANQIDFKDAPDIEGDENLQLITGPFLNVQFLAFNQAIPPFDNPSLRMAVQQAINKESIAEVVASGHYTLGAGPIAPTLLGYDPSLAERYPYDPEQAKSLIAESGLTDITFDLYNRANSFWPVLGQLIQADLANVGITANLQSLEDAEFLDQVNTGKVQAFLNDWTWDNGDPDNVMFSLFTHERAVTRLGYKNERVNELNLEAQVTADPDARAALYVEAQKLIMDDAIMVVLGYPEKAIGAQATVQNLVVSPVGSVVLREVDFGGVDMTRYLLRRLVLTIPILLGVSLLVFLMLHSAGGDPAQTILGARADPESIAALDMNWGSTGRCWCSTPRFLAARCAVTSGALPLQYAGHRRDRHAVPGHDRACSSCHGDRRGGRSGLRHPGGGAAAFDPRLPQLDRRLAGGLDSDLLVGADPDHHLWSLAALAADLRAGQSAPGCRPLAAIPDSRIARAGQLDSGERRAAALDPAGADAGGLARRDCGQDDPSLVNRVPGAGLRAHRSRQGAA